MKDLNPAIPGDGKVPPKTADSVIKPYVLSHGTLECYDLKASRKFYEEFLGLEVVRHAKPAMVVRCGLKFHIVCVESGQALRPVTDFNHWGLELSSKEAVDRAREDALRLKDKYGIRQIGEAKNFHGAYSFYFEDLDHNWWEISFYDGFIHDDDFDFGDRFSMEDARALETA